MTSVNDDYQTFVFHQSVIVPRTVSGVVIAVHYFSARGVGTSPQEVCLDSFKAISLKALIKYNINFVSPLIPNLSIDDDYQTFASIIQLLLSALKLEG